MKESVKSITSVSGGKTSAFMALHYPTDLNVFAVVLTDDNACTPKDKGLLREAQNRIPWFQGSRELDLTLLNVLKLEQRIGRAIDWVAAPFTFDRLIGKITDKPGLKSGNTFLPNSRHRLCTEHLKIAPIFEYWFHRCAPSIAVMNIGLRWDEPKRVEGWTCDKDRYRYPQQCAISNQRQKWTETDWRISDFPLYRDKVTQPQIIDFWQSEGWEFPKISNCDFCFFHRPIQQQIQAELHPDRVQWWIDWETKAGQSFGTKPLEQTLNQLLLPVYDDESSGCFCTD